MMGAVYHRKENRHKYPKTTKLFSELRDLVEHTAFYDEIVDAYHMLPEYRYRNGKIN